MYKSAKPAWHTWKQTEKFLPGPLFLTSTLLIWVEAQEVFTHIGQLVHERSPAFQVHSTQLHVIGWVIVGQISWTYERGPAAAVSQENPEVMQAMLVD